MNCEKFLDQLRVYKLLAEVCAPFSLLVHNSFLSSEFHTKGNGQLASLLQTQ